MKTVSEISKITGVSKRTIRYYDNIGLLKPSEVSASGYRLYDQNDIETLQQILFLRELDMPIKEIKIIISNPNLNKQELLIKHKKILLLKKQRLTKLINLIDKKLKESNIMSIKEFNNENIKKLQKQYATEVKEKYGHTAQYKEFQEKELKRSTNEQSAVIDNFNLIFKKFANIMDYGSNSKEAYQLAEELQNYITQNFYECTDEMLKSLGELYVSDKRFSENIDKHAQNLSTFVKDSIISYLNHK